MQLPSYVKPYPKVIAWILPHFGGNSIYPFIFLRSEIFRDLKSDQPNPKHLATLAHELHHRQRQQAAGWFGWGCSYLFSRQFRFEEELSAYKITMQIRKYYQQDFDNHRCAKVLSGPTYLWSASYDKALENLKSAWANTEPQDPNKLIQF